MNDDQKLDLALLDPMRDPTRWRSVVEATLQRLDPELARRRRRDPLTLIAEWSRPVVITSATALVLLAPVELALELQEERAEQVQRLVDLSGELGIGEQPSGSEFLRALADDGAVR